MPLSLTHSPLRPPTPRSLLVWCRSRLPLSLTQDIWEAVGGKLAQFSLTRITRMLWKGTTTGFPPPRALVAATLDRAALEWAGRMQGQEHQGQGQSQEQGQRQGQPKRGSTGLACVSRLLVIGATLTLRISSQQALIFAGWCVVKGWLSLYPCTHAPMRSQMLCLHTKDGKECKHRTPVSISSSG